ncbi:replication protein A 70 kDa DNA-binding subunit A-like [Leptopilina heterotoma]|uniref:replication protein A 70 kDa DNA-binding subunit A-like n=1 Tax=Leptopilina heterotoma TaxID=63436 RepID=UPI001CA99CC8|nr:replication protein A 70 kDa DNA-binding subunit A-like [Leptopilina heterotoma]
MLPQNAYNFKSIEEAKLLEPGEFVDICGIVTKVDDIQDITVKNGSKLTKRPVIITDANCNTIEIALWNNLSKTIELNLKDIIIIKRGKIGNFRNTNYISVLQSSMLKINDMENEESKRLSEQNKDDIK